MDSALFFLKQRRGQRLLFLSVTNAYLLGIYFNSRYYLPLKYLRWSQEKHPSLECLYFICTNWMAFSWHCFIHAVGDEMRGQYKFSISYIFCSARSMACFPTQHTEVIFVILPIKNHLVLYFEDKQTSYPVHMVNINIILSMKDTGIPSYFFGFQHNGSDNVAAPKYWGFGTACYLLSEEYCLYETVFILKWLFWTFISLRPFCS